MLISVPAARIRRLAYDGNRKISQIRSLLYFEYGKDLSLEGAY